MAVVPTPKTQHLDFSNVYEPVEDSFLLLDALELQLVEIRDCLKPSFCFELGCGSGIISTGLSTALGSSCYFLCCDINQEACLATLSTKAANNAAHFIDVVRADMLSGLDLNSKVDLVLCNPPYVATPDSECHDGIRDKDIKASWAGGHCGRSMTDALIKMLPDILSEKGVAYVVLEQCNEPDAVERLAHDLALKTRTVIKRRAGREMLSVLKLTT